MNDPPTEKLIQLDSESLWELYHENSKQSPWFRIKSDNEFVRLSKMHLSLPHAYIHSIPIPPNLQALSMPLGEVIARRRSSRKLSGQMHLEDLATIVNSAFGRTLRQGIPRPLRAAPSGGRSFPLEAYIAVQNVKDMKPGLYHFDAENEALGCISEGPVHEVITEAFVQHDVLQEASAVIILSAVFARTTDKYGERGYRLILLEAGHAAQNMDLAATALGLEHVNLAAFYDHKLEDLLEIDGVNHSVLYCIGLGGKTNTQ